MELPLSPPQPPQSQHVVSQPRISETDVHLAVTEDDPSAALWDWGDLLDFTVDDHFPVSEDPPPTDHTPPITTVPHLLEISPSDRIRKRDPRLTCSNFLAGRVPCACPELDEQLRQQEEEENARGKKRVRTVRVASGAARCQVPGCEVDIRELKGYHKRHRVCLRCANASEVVLDGETKRYCQQCGKFHIVSDFDEGKRSCRRKLERHNNRRRRKPSNSRVAVDKEPQGVTQTEDVTCDDEAGRDSLCLSDPIAEKEAFLESEDGQITTLSSGLESQNINSDSVASFMASGEIQMDREKDNPKYSPSPKYYDNKTTYSSMCPTGRISFKLYDWNPAEFPRRLRHQIFQWLSNMPVELEGYIRPGCTILTVFIAMPEFMWVKLIEDPESYVHDFVVAPGSMLSGRGTVLVYLNNMIFRVMKGISGTSVMKVKVEVHAPRLHYVHPICFEAGKPLEFVACGSNLLQPKFRFLVSFAGKYLARDYCVASLHGQTGGDTASTSSHQLHKICIPHTESNLFGPAFIEVENESGLSNFIPVLIGDKEICSEMEKLQQRLDASLFSEGSQCATIDPLCDSCDSSALRQSTFSEFILDIGWLLKEPASENFQQNVTASQIQRLNSLLNFLICNDSTTILEKVLQKLKIVLNNTKFNSVVNGTYDADLRLLQKYIDDAGDILSQKNKISQTLVLQSGSLPIRDCDSQSCSQRDMLSVVPLNSEDVEIIGNGKLGVKTCSGSIGRSETVPLLNGDVVMNVNLIKEWPRKSCGRIFYGGMLRPRPSIFVIAFTTVCLGICAVLFHPNKVSEFAVTIRRCLFD